MVATFAASVRPVGSKTTLDKALRSVPVTTWHAIALMLSGSMKCVSHEMGPLRVRARVLVIMY